LGVEIYTGISEEFIFCHLHTKCYVAFLWPGKQNSKVKLVVINNGVGSSVMKQNFRPKIGVTIEIAVTYAKKETVNSDQFLNSSIVQSKNL
jgi:hypothetical protein